MNYSWNILNQEVPENLLDALLHARGIKEEDRASFLSPNWEDGTHDPFLFTQMQKAVERTIHAIKNEQSIVVHGDYDADGVCGSSVLTIALRKVAEGLHKELHLEAFLPDRERDGYGVAMHTVERFGKEGKNLLITVDCGIANAAELARAHELGMDVIICDHHQLAETIPEYALIIHPLAPGETYPNKHLCGTGVAYKFASALFVEARNQDVPIPEGFEKWLLDFVAVATVTDVMPIKGENRVLEFYGLKVLNKTRNHGLREIINVGRSELGSIDTQAIGFQIGPRINAAGRLKSAEIAYKTLTAKTQTDAESLAAELEMINRERRRVSDATYKEAQQSAQNAHPYMTVVWSETWHPGVIGLAAGKLVQERGVPAFVLTRVGDHFVGSGRSVGGLHLVEAMNACGDIYVKYGGHPQACGLTLYEKHLETFKQGVEAFAQTFFGSQAPKPVLDIDAHVPLEYWDMDRFANLSALEPFGEGNRPPVFYAPGLEVVDARGVGANEAHLRLEVRAANGTTWSGIGFSFGSYMSQLDVGDNVDLAYTLSINEWNGKRTLQFEIKDLNKV